MLLRRAAGARRLSSGARARRREVLLGPGGVETGGSDADGARRLGLGSGKLARLAAGAAVATDGDGVLLATACSDKAKQVGAAAGPSFLPLSVEVREKASAAGKIPGHVLRRELAPREAEVVQARFVDRALRPLFGADVRDEQQIICTVLSYDEGADLEAMAVNAASVALNSATPRPDWHGPVGCVRVTARTQGPTAGDDVVFSAFQSPQNLAAPDREIAFELLVTGTREGIISLDLSTTNPVSCTNFKRALRFASEKLPIVLDLQDAATAAILEKKREAKQTKESDNDGDAAAEAPPKFRAAITGDPSAEIENDLQPTNLDTLYQMAFATDAPSEKTFNAGKEDADADEGGGDNTEDRSESLGKESKSTTSLDMESHFMQKGSAWLREQAQNGNADSIGRDKMREFLLRSSEDGSGRVRHDGRTAHEVRPLAAALNVLPSVVHGSSTFSRGQTSVLATATLGSPRDALRVLPYCGQTYKKKFFLHYEFPPYSVNETGRVGLNRRMIGHGQLAEKALRPVVPGENDIGGNEFPFSTRVSVETTSSDGSSSMASVCAASLALKMAGVPIKNLVAGISVGYLRGEADDGADGSEESERLLVDVDSLEDDFGNMDFKLASTETGFTAAQLDTKCGAEGISVDLLCRAAELGQAANREILDVMQSSLDSFLEAHPDGFQASSAPVYRRIDVDPALIGRVIGMRGRVIASIQEEYNVEVDIDQERGTITIFSTSSGFLDDALHRVEDLIWCPEVGRDYADLEIVEQHIAGVVVRFPGHGGDHEGFIHVSELSTQRIERAGDVYSVGDKVKARCIGMDDFRPRLSIRDIQLAENRELALRKSRASKPGEEGADEEETSSALLASHWVPEEGKVYENLEVVKIPHVSRVIVALADHPESRGIVQARELSPRRIDDVNKIVKVGDKIDAVCISSGGSEEGLPELSVRRVLLLKTQNASKGQQKKSRSSRKRNR
ncbi:Polyribonucleotide nucleotidyltransferase 1, mitochondrial [Hondaea fermentalgiana]|uniref:polyribonucleotide nucleotidyltransferase n=1 Tax=Hondaea fermentalgiana TaxID=2315210 RepID=A0A2R5GIN6_9STRA|nr:Polyribonucleotide nucleotidyltransferase 1, mitochondrial [Hondaea fermentalgiana]|eukprot:GBG28151.1 Polyribonucleotide nucleotidyltransferase 1, mitochondrial [Hondaea fermentalgiana]